MRISGLTVLLFLFSLPMCVSAGSVMSFGSMLSSYKMTMKDGGGCISGSIGDAVPGNREASLYFVSEENSEKLRKSAYVRYADDVKKNEFLPGLSTFTMCLKPGRYRIYGITTENLYSKDRFNVPFEVVAGKHFYIGSFVFYGYSINPDCEQTSSQIYVGFRDEFLRDSVYLEKNPEASPAQLERRVIDPASGTPYFVKCSS